MNYILIFINQVKYNTINIMNNINTNTNSNSNRNLYIKLTQGINITLYFSNAESDCFP